MSAEKRIAELEEKVAQLEKECHELRAELEKNGLNAGDNSEKKILEQAKDNFLNLITHEIRTPLTSVNGALEILTDEMVGELTEIQKEFLLMALTNTKRLITLMETAFEITQLETGQLHLHHTKVELKEVVERILSHGLREGFEKKQIRLNLDFKQAEFVYGDYRRLLQIFENLLSNACKFTPNGGTVSVVSLPANDGKVNVSVIDSGIGMSQVEQRHIFEKFFRAEHAFNRHVGGIGLGLNITSSLIKLHGSELQLETIPGKGTCFTFTMSAIS